jgi:hypothetical protein
MGLDWIAMGKPKPGFEARFREIYDLLGESDGQKTGILGRLFGKKTKTREELLEEWNAISDKSYETIRAPRVGRDKSADDWARTTYLETDKSKTEEEFMNDLQGYYVIELATELDGVPVYQSPVADESAFRGAFLQDCEDLIGEDLLNEAWGTKFADEALEYGNQLMAIADKVAVENNLQYLKDQRMPPDFNEDTMESELHILYAASKWLIFYGKNGHGFEADF